MRYRLNYTIAFVGEQNVVYDVLPMPLQTLLREASKCVCPSMPKYRIYKTIGTQEALLAQVRLSKGWISIDTFIKE